MHIPICNANRLLIKYRIFSVVPGSLWILIFNDCTFIQHLSYIINFFFGINETWSLGSLINTISYNVIFCEVINWRGY